jgi:hypothetical protein
MELLYILGWSFLTLYVIEVACTFININSPSYYLQQLRTYVEKVFSLLGIMSAYMSRYSHKISVAFVVWFVAPLIYLLGSIIYLVISPCHVIYGYIEAAEKSKYKTQLHLGILHIFAILQIIWIVRVAQFCNTNPKDLDRLQQYEVGLCVLTFSIILGVYMEIIGDMIKNVDKEEAPEQLIEPVEQQSNQNKKRKTSKNKNKKYDRFLSPNLLAY